MGRKVRCSTLLVARSLLHLVHSGSAACAAAYGVRTGTLSQLHSGWDIATTHTHLASKLSMSRILSPSVPAWHVRQETFILL